MEGLQIIISKEIPLIPPLSKGESNEVVPNEIQVIPAGFHSTEKGDFDLDQHAANDVVEAFNAQKNDMVIDYEHQTLQGAEAPAAGWIKKLIFKSPLNPPFEKGGHGGIGLS